VKQPLIVIEAAATGYNSEVVLRDVGLTVYPDDFIGIIGPNGGGKTTLVKLILGLQPLFSGKVLFPSGKPRMGYLPQASQVDRSFPITVKELISSGMKSRNTLIPYLNAGQKQRLEEMIREAGLQRYANKPIGELSGGQLQKALLCRALIDDPQLLILDEPNTHVDKQFEQELYRWLKRLNQQMAILLVSHDIGTISPLIKSIACVNETLHYHPSNQISEEVLKVYHCPVDVIAHGPVPHRVLKSHDHE